MPVVTTTSTARTNFYANESWWGQQLKRAKSIIYQTTPYSCAKLAKVLELRNPHFYYFVNGPQNCQVRNKIEFIIQTARWKQIEPHIKFIYPAAKLLAKSYIELLDLNCTNPDRYKGLSNQARHNFEENGKNPFCNIPLQKLHPFQPTLL